MEFYKKTIKRTLKELNTSSDGLTTREAQLRQKKNGLNKLKETKKISPLKIFLNQFKSSLVIILIAATTISAFIGEFIDASVILVIIILNTILGFIQEYKAEKAIESLKKMIKINVKVIRNGKEMIMDAAHLTIGDIMVLEEGDKVSADARIIETINLEAQESALTGESLPIAKIQEPLKGDKPVSDQTNMVFSGTSITKGRGRAVVTKIGMETQLGKIAGLIQQSEEKKTPLQLKLAQLSRWLGVVTIAICTILFITYYFFSGIDMQTAFLTAIALAVAAIPEGLPAVVTISLGIGIKRMIKQNVLVRKLPSVETLGAVTVICTDKTGTLTKNEMTVRKIFANNIEVDVTGSGYKPVGKFSKDSKGFSRLLEIGLLCNNSILEKGSFIGDPTEAALIVSGMKASMDVKQLKKSMPRIDEIPFDSERKMMSSIHKYKKQKIILSKGALEIILSKCNRILINGRVENLTKNHLKKIKLANDKFASQALRVLGFAYSENSTSEQKLIFAGMQAMIDPPRDDVRQSIERCKLAGISIKMITGDHKGTAMAIAKELGLKGKVITGQELDKIKNLDKEIDAITVFARVNPEHKYKIVEALRKKGHIIAMTGDGVNDAPALKHADIGVAMGIAGTDVAREASDMILTDDHFSSIVNAVEEGRGIYDNMKKFVNYLLSSNMGEILIIFLASLMGFPLPLLAIHILWVNLITDGLPALALGVDPIDKSVMNRKPRNTKEHIVSSNMIWNIVVIGILMSVSSLILFARNYEQDLVQARSAVLILIVLMELIRVQMVRSTYGTSLFSNKWLIGAVLTSIALVMIIVYTPLNTIFKTAPIPLSMWYEIGLSLLFLAIVGYISSKIIRKLTHEMD